MNSSSHRRKTTTALLTIAQLGQAQWFFGNLYEAVVHIPERIAAESGSDIRSERPGLPALLRPGSPVRYFLPAAPITLAASIAAVIAGWGEPQDRKWLGASAASTVSGAVLTGYVVRQINYKLFFAAQPLAPAEQQELLQQWHRLNKLRLAASGIAWLTGQRAAADSRRSRWRMARMLAADAKASVVADPDRVLLIGSRSIPARPAGAKGGPPPRSTGITRISSTRPLGRHWPVTSAPKISRFLPRAASRAAATPPRCRQRGKWLPGSAGARVVDG